MVITTREIKLRFLLLDWTGSVKELLYPVMGIGLGSQVASLAVVGMPTQWKTHSSLQAAGKLQGVSFFTLFDLSFQYLKGEFPYSVDMVAGSEWALPGWECRVEVV